ncbi:hypothetical protein L596_007949 [Steinernema carpocapsae]|uniref:Uncharacterized protein n=1 Tax=Steinernema carpocapsae TaxID=34508 RepID=A0A4U5PB24_STECR|nr:hypothetical protein L596_007949 [Steinernema carpocapsae]
MRVLVVRDQHTKIFGQRLLNSQLSLYIGLLQLLICIWSLTQHVYSIIYYDEGQVERVGRGLPKRVICLERATKRKCGSMESFN